MVVKTRKEKNASVENLTKIYMPTLSVSCAQLTRDLLAIATSLRNVMAIFRPN